MSTETMAASRAAAGLMRRLARVQAQSERMEAELNGRLDAVKGVYAGRMSALATARRAVLEALERHCRANRVELMHGGAKSFRTAYGRAGFRLRPVQLIATPDQDEELICQRLRERHLSHLVRVRETPDRPAIRKALDSGQMGEGLLAQCGLRLGGRDEAFFCVLDRVSSDESVTS